MTQAPPPGPNAAETARETVEALAERFAGDPGAPERNRPLWALAREAAPTPELMDALVAGADRLGPDGWLATGVLLRRGLRPLDALEAFERARAARPPADPAPDVEAGRLLAELRSHELALARFERHPQAPAAIHGRAVVLARLRRHDEAVTLVEGLLARDPGNPAALLLRAELLDSAGRGSEALAPLRSLVATTGAAGGAAGPAAFRLARILVTLGEHGDARPLLEAVLATGPENAEAWLALARVRRAEGRPADAEAAYRRALAEDPALGEARFGLAQLLAREGRREESAPLFEEFERRKAIEDESGRLLGEAELRPEEFGPARAFVLHALRSGDFALALRGAQRFLVEVPEDFERHLLLARVFVEGGGHGEARRVLERALERFRGTEAAVRRLEAGLAALARRQPA